MGDVEATGDATPDPVWDMTIERRFSTETERRASSVIVEKEI
jgi:hypothetical protein